MAIPNPPLSRDQIPSALEANLRRYYLESLSAVEGLYEQIYNVDGSEIKVEREAVYAGVGTFPTKAEGGVVAFDTPTEAWNQSFTHKAFALGIKVTWEATQDDLHGVIRSMEANGGDLAAVARYTKERDALDLFNNTLTSGTAYTAGGTNYPVLSTTHFRVDGGTWTNRPAAAMDLSIEALEFMVGHWVLNMVNQRGQVMFTFPERLMVAPVDYMLSQRLLRSSGLPTTNSNDPNVVTDHVKSAMMHPLFNNDGRWVAFGPKERTGLRYYNRFSPDVQKWPDEQGTGNMIFVCLYRESHGLSHAYNIWGSP